MHVDVKYLPQMQDEDKRRYVFVAIHQATRWVFIAIKPHKTAAAASPLASTSSISCVRPWALSTA